MPEQVSFIKIKGTVDGLSFYTAGGRSIVRRAYGPSKERIANDPKLIRLRENNVEFGGASAMGKALRLGLMVTKLYASSDLPAKVTALMRSVLVLNKGIRGKRNIELSKHKTLLNHLDCNSQTPFTNVVLPSFECSGDRNTASVQYTFRNMNPAADIRPPQGATHFQIFQIATTISDYHYNEPMESYRPINSQLNEAREITNSNAISLSDQSVDVSLVTTIPGITNLPEHVSLVHALAIAFFREDNNVHYKLTSGCAMKVIGVY
ncbi:hypothetical protein [Chryseosolibacter indicus]|uniref:Uncharacterized protein n=1 Tax=Chryseosolibacter indicus TaxID=2782351 RepID=A0ABS5VN37_9BACT|nr:hypothetical protein [Chryseosolibacter indicus]MBT1702536.1 hypothetical protein [Chryseosolibacter indicus]